MAFSQIFKSLKLEEQTLACNCESVCINMNNLSTFMQKWDKGTFSK